MAQPETVTSDAVTSEAVTSDAVTSGTQPHAVRRPGARTTDRSTRRLTRTQAERVIARALELQDAEGLEPADRLSLGDVEEIAADVGVAPSAVRHAVRELRLAEMVEQEPAPGERLLGPRRVAGVAVVPGPPDRVRRGLELWMTHDEAMARVGSRGDLERWTKDRRVMTEVRRGLGATRASGTLRDLRAVTTRVEADRDGGEAADRSVVVVEADTTSIRTTVVGVASAGLAVALGAGFAAASAPHIPLLADDTLLVNDAAQFAVGFGATAAAGAATAVAIGRSWLRGVRRAVDEAVDGIGLASRDPDGYLEPTPTTGWRSTARRWLGVDG